MKKKLLSLVLGASMAVGAFMGFAGCNSNSADQSMEAPKIPAGVELNDVEVSQMSAKYYDILGKIYDVDNNNQASDITMKVYSCSSVDSNFTYDNNGGRKNEIYKSNYENLIELDYLEGAKEYGSGVFKTNSRFISENERENVSQEIKSGYSCCLSGGRLESVCDYYNTKDTDKLKNTEQSIDNPTSLRSLRLSNKSLVNNPATFLSLFTATTLPYGESSLAYFGNRLDDYADYLENYSKNDPSSHKYEYIPGDVMEGEDAFICDNNFTVSKYICEVKADDNRIYVNYERTYVVNGESATGSKSVTYKFTVYLDNAAAHKTADFKETILNNNNTQYVSYVTNDVNALANSVFAEQDITLNFAKGKNFKDCKLGVSGISHEDGNLWRLRDKDMDGNQTSFAIESNLLAGAQNFKKVVLQISTFELLGSDKNNIMMVIELYNPNK